MPNRKGMLTLSRGVAPSCRGKELENVETEDIVLVESWGDGQLVKLGEEASSASHPDEGILLDNL